MSSQGILIACCCCCCLLLLLLAIKTQTRTELGPSLVWIVWMFALEITVEERSLALPMCFHRRDDRAQTRLKKWLVFTSKWTIVWHHGMVHALLITHLPSFNSPIAIKEQRPSLETPTRHTGNRPELSGGSSRKQPKNRPFLDTKLAVEGARRLKMQRNLFVVMRVCSRSF